MQRLGLALLVLPIGCAAGSFDQPVDPQPAAVLSIDRTSVDFGDTIIGTVAPAAAFVITNTGTPAILSTTLGGPDAEAFQITADTCGQHDLASGGTCSIAVTFAPGVARPHTAQLIASAPGTSAVAALGGTGVAPARPALLEISPATQDLGAAVIGLATTRFAFVVGNTGGSPTGPLFARTAGDPDFEIVSNGCASLAPGATCTIELVLAPTAAGARAGSLGVTGTPGGSAEVSLTGTGIAPGQLAITPSSYDFLIVDAGETTAHDLVVTNTGGAATGALATSISGAVELGLAGDTCTGKILAPATSCTVTARFAPTIYGARHATFTAISSPGGAATASLAGTGRDHVSLTIAVPAGGTVTSTGGTTVSGNAIACPGASCSEAYVRTVAPPFVLVTAHADPEWHFDRWIGGPCATQGATCQMTLDTATSITAVFAVDTYPLTVTAAGSGTVTSSPVAIASCNGTCTATFPAGTQVTLTASGPAISRWTGACAGSGTTCTITIDGPAAVGVAFADCSGEFRADGDTVALWHINEGAGQIVGDAMGRYPGTLGKDVKIANDDPMWSLGRFGNALYFDASNCPSIPDEHCEWMHVLTGPIAFPNGFSIELWIDPTGILGSTTIYGDDGDGPRFADLFGTESPSTWMSMTGGTQVTWEVDAADSYGPATEAPSLTLANQWHAFAATYDGETARFYVDGVRVAQQDGEIAQGTAVNFDLGGIPLHAFFNGYLDEVRISSVPRSATEIATAYAIANVCP